MIKIEEQLRELILDKYGSLKSFCDKINMPPTTLYTILKRGVLNSNIDNIKIICKELKIKIDSLATDKIEFITIETINDLCTDEIDLLNKYRLLNDNNKQLVVSLIKQLNTK